MTTDPAPPPTRPTGALARMVRACADHPWRTMSAWLVVIVLVVGASNAFGGKLINQFVVPGSDAQNAVDLLEERFPERAGDSTQIVFHSEDGFESAAARQDIAAAAEAAMGVPGVIGAGDPYSGQAGAISEDGTIAFVDVQFDTPGRGGRDLQHRRAGGRRPRRRRRHRRSRWSSAARSSTASRRAPTPARCSASRPPSSCC